MFRAKLTFKCDNLSEGIYTVIVTDANNCTDEHTLFIPNGFSPNFDGKNDIFKIEHHGILEGSFKIAIYDRWGSIIYTSSSPDFE